MLAGTRVTGLKKHKGIEATQRREGDDYVVYARYVETTEED